MSGIGEHLFAQVCRFLGCSYDLGQVLLYGKRIGFTFGDTERGVTHDRGQYIVEVVCDTAREHTQAFEFLRMLELLLHLFLFAFAHQLFSDVCRDTDQCIDVAVRIVYRYFSGMESVSLTFMIGKRFTRRGGHIFIEAGAVRQHALLCQLIRQNFRIMIDFDKVLFGDSDFRAECVVDEHDLAVFIQHKNARRGVVHNQTHQLPLLFHLSGMGLFYLFDLGDGLLCKRDDALRKHGVFVTEGGGFRRGEYQHTARQ